MSCLTCEAATDTTKHLIFLRMRNKAPLNQTVESAAGNRQHHRAVHQQSLVQVSVTGSVKSSATVWLLVQIQDHEQRDQLFSCKEDRVILEEKYQEGFYVSSGML